jgi:ankyrin repeat protein
MSTGSIWIQAATGWSHDVQRLLDGGADIDKQVWFTDGVPGDASRLTNMTLLHVACAHGHGNVVRVLLENGACMSIKDNLGRTPLYIAVYEGDNECAELLLQRGSDVNTECLGMAALHTAVVNEDMGMVLKLLRYNASVLTPNRNGHVARYYSTTSPDIDEILREEEETTHKCLAFAMSHHHRLGAGSMVSALDPELVRKVLEHVL